MNSPLNEFAAKVESGDIKINDESAEISTTQTTAERLSAIVDDDDDVFVGIDTSMINSTEVESIEDRIKKAAMANLNGTSMDSSLMDSTLKDVIDDTRKYHKTLMLENGFTSEEADAASIKRAVRMSIEKRNEYVTNNPDTAIIKVDATNVDNVTAIFDADTTEKIKKAKTIRLVEVAMKELPTMKLYDMPKDIQQLNAIRAKTCIAAKYELPLINTFEHAEFAGASSMALATAVMDDEDSVSDYLVTKKQAEFIYEHFIGSTTLDKCDAQGNTLCSFSEFANWLRYPDLDTCLYMVYVASSTEVINSEFFCKVNNCILEAKRKLEVAGKIDEAQKMEIQIAKGEASVPFSYTYNSKELIKYDDIPESLKADFDMLLSTKCHTFDGLEDEKRERRAAKIVRSEFTKNYYVIEIPSVATALNMLEASETTETTIGNQTSKMYYVGFSLMIREIRMYGGVDEKTGEDIYYRITNNQPEGGVVPLMKIVSTLPETELKLLQKVFGNMTYMPKFVIHTVCQHCGNVADTPFDIKSLVFLKATGTEAAIEA